MFRVYPRRGCNGRFCATGSATSAFAATANTDCSAGRAVRAGMEGDRTATAVSVRQRVDLMIAPKKEGGPKAALLNY